MEEGNLEKKIFCNFTHFSDVLFIPLMHEPYKWAINGKGKEQAFHTGLNACDKVTAEI